MNRIKITQVKIGSSEKLEDFKFSIQTDSHEEKADETLEFGVYPSRSVRLISRHKLSESYESQVFDSNLLSTNNTLSIPVYKSSRPGKVQGKVSLSLVNFSGQSTNPGSERSESSKSYSLASTPSLEESSNRLISSLSESINQELKVSVTKLRKLLELEKNAKENSAKDLLKVKKDAEIEREEFSKREKQFFSEIQAAESGLASMKCELLKIRTENKALISENQRISMILKEKESLSESVLSEFEDFSKNFSISFCPINRPPEIVERDLIIKDLTREINELKLLNKSGIASRQIIKTTDLDEVLSQKLKNYQITGSFVRDPEQNYIFNGKKVSLVVKNSQLLCKFGASYKTFDDYMKKLGVPATRSSSHKRIRSLEIQNETKGLNTNSKIKI